MFCFAPDALIVPIMDLKSIHLEDAVRKNELLTVKEVADYFRVSRVTMWRWCQQGLVPAFQIGRIWRIRRADLLAIETMLIAGHNGFNKNVD